MDYLVTRGDFLRTDLKFLLEGDSYSVCNRCFGNIQNVFNAQEKTETPQDWETIIVASVLSSIKVYWVGLDMIKDYKSFLKLKYISENEDLQHENLRSKKSHGLILELENSLTIGAIWKFHPDCAFMHFTIDPKQQPNLVL